MRIKLLKLPVYETDINEDTYETKYPMIPLGLSILKASLNKSNIAAVQDDLSVKIFRQNIKNKLIDMKLFNNEKKVNNFIKTKSDLILEKEGEKMLALTNSRGFDLFGFSVEVTNNPSTSGIVSVLSKLIKEKYSVPIICGGRAPPEVVNKWLRNKIIDYWVNEGPYNNQAQVLVEVCKQFEKRSFDPKNIPLLSYFQNGKIMTNQAFMEKDEFITPDFDGLPLDMYRKNRKILSEKFGPVVDNILILPYFFITGCPNSCAFCSNGPTKYFMMKDPEKVSADLKLLSKKYRTKYFYFLNSSINPTKVYVNNLLKSFTNNNVSVLFTDCASFRNMDEKLLEKLKANGATRLIYGLETASPRLLKYINKSLDIAHAERMLKKSFELGIISEIELIPGLPYERDEDIKKTVRFVEKNKKYIQHANIFKFWLDGWFLKAPDRFGLRLLSTKEEKLYIPGNKRVFEEISGLNYRQKIEQTEKSYRVLRKHSILYHINDVPGITIDEYLFIMNITHIMYRQSGILKKRFQKYNQIAE